MKKALIALAAILLALGTGAYVFREQLMIAAIASQIAPEHGFDPALAPDAPDYSQDSRKQWSLRQTAGCRRAPCRRRARSSML